MAPSPEVLAIAPAILRAYALSFLLLPALLGPDAIWYAMPLTELLVFLAVAVLLRRTVRSMEAAPAQ